MKIGFLVHSVEHQLAKFTTTALAQESVRRGHTTAFLETGPFLAAERETPARLVSNPVQSAELFLRDLRNTPIEKQSLSSFDVIFCRYNSSSPFFQDDAEALLNRLEELQDAGLCILNNPKSLRKAATKEYLAEFPASLRPRHRYCTEWGEARSFVQSLKSSAVIKPVRGSGGMDVIRVFSENDPELSLSFQRLRKRGPVLVEEFLHAQPQGDLRVLLLEGEILTVGSTPCAFRRVSPKEDFRSNIQLGGRKVMTSLTADQRAILQEIGTKLKQDDLFFVGVDLLGNKLLELNVITPGGVLPTTELYGINVSAAILAQAEKRATHKHDQ